MKRKPDLFTGHLERYLFACRYCEGKRVLDLGSKDGYGSHIVSRFAKKVTLADRNSVWLASAQSHYKYMCSVDFVLCDLEKEFPDGEYDTIIAFELIEHVANSDFLIENIVNHLPVGGLLVFSVPHMIANPDHKVLFDEKGIKDLISKYMKIKEFYIQDSYCISGRKPSAPPKSYVGVAEKI